MGQLVLRSRRLPVSARVDARVLLATVAAAAVTAVGVALNLSLGEYDVALPDVLASLLGQSVVGDFVVTELRLPRVLVALLAGVALALSGQIFQSVSHNPLVSPDIIGINVGAALAGVALIVLGGSPELFPVVGLIGGFSAAALVYGLAWKQGLSPYRMVLIGIVMTTVIAGLNSYIVAEYVFSENDAGLITRWTLGTAYATGWSELGPLAIALLVLAPLLLAVSRRLDILQLGDDLAAGLGSRVERTRLAVLGVAVALASVAVAEVGPIGFVAFVAPHIARRISGATGSAALPVAAAVGAALMVLADLGARLLFAPSELPTGVVTTAVGGPYFLYLLLRANRSQWGTS